MLRDCREMPLAQGAFRKFGVWRKTFENWRCEEKSGKCGENMTLTPPEGNTSDNRCFEHHAVVSWQSHLTVNQSDSQTDQSTIKERLSV